MTVVPFPPSYADALDLADGCIERIKSGRTRALALVEVLDDGTVFTAWSQTGNQYHELNSGVAILAFRLCNARMEE